MDVQEQAEKLEKKPDYCESTPKSLEEWSNIWESPYRPVFLYKLDDEPPSLIIILSKDRQ
ncbi:hypothetical protein [Gracilibacillus xinjiangensis]|uniref:Uncharacterized protein n=1 Tax=Gracilibacillus xinjiangensis TaxID=1193282 RepID=A0ABV8X060_9BACI